MAADLMIYLEGDSIRVQRLVTICGQSRDIVTSRDKYLHLLTSPDEVLFPVPVQTSARGRGPHRGRGQVLAGQGFAGKVCDKKHFSENNETLLHKSVKDIKKLQE